MLGRISSSVCRYREEYGGFRQFQSPNTHGVCSTMTSSAEVMLKENQQQHMPEMGVQHHPQSPSSPRIPHYHGHPEPSSTDRKKSTAANSNRDVEESWSYTDRKASPFSEASSICRSRRTQDQTCRDSATAVASQHA